MNAVVVEAQARPAALANSRLAREIESIVDHVQASRLIDRRTARRFVGRRLNQNTLSYWRVYRMFPVGFRNGSKPTDARLYRDSGRYGK